MLKSKEDPGAEIPELEEMTLVIWQYRSDLEILGLFQACYDVILDCDVMQCWQSDVRVNGSEKSDLRNGLISIGYRENGVYSEMSLKND